MFKLTTADANVSDSPFAKLIMSHIFLAGQVPRPLQLRAVKFSGGNNALYERHLTFDQVVPVENATPRDKFEAVARSIRDVLSQRWLKTERTHQQNNAKRVYYLSMEFLIGRMLANNWTNMQLDSVLNQAFGEKKLDPLEIIQQEPDAGLGNGGLDRLAANHGGDHRGLPFDRSALTSSREPATEEWGWPVRFRARQW